MTIGTRRPVALVRTFMTHEMRDEDIAALSTGRDDEFRRIMEAIGRSLKASPGPLQHIVLYGSRGFGKSFMTRRVQMAVGELDATERRMLYVLLPEEQHNLQRSPHAFLDTIRHNLQNLDGTDDAAFEEGHFQWPRRGEDAIQWNEAVSRLEAAVDDALGSSKGLVVVVVENFDTLLSTLFSADEAEQRLRLWLDRPKNRIMLLATATGTVDIDYDRPLFKAFEPVRLSPWSGDDCIAYFNKLREREGKRPLTAAQEAKGRAIADFIGGTPRLAQLLAEVIETQDALTVAQTMSALADKLAEYYRRRIEDLSPLARGLLDALIRGGEPASQTELARRVGARGQSDIARVMADLQRADVVRGRRSPDSREMLYSATDRVFVHYYRLRQGSRVARTTPLATILEFLKSFYSQDEQRQQMLVHLDAGRPEEASLFSELALDGKQALGGSYTEGFDRRWALFLSSLPLESCAVEPAAVQLGHDPASAFHASANVEQPTPACAVLISILQAQAVFRLGGDERAEALLEKAQSLADTSLLRLLVSCERSDFAAFVRADNDGAAEFALMGLDAALDAAVPDKLRLRGLRDAVWALVEQERVKETLEILPIGLSLSRSLKDEVSELFFLKHWLLALRLADRFDELFREADLARSLAERVGRGRDRAMVAWVLASAYRAVGDLTKAIASADEATEYAEGPSTELLRLGALSEAGNALATAGDYARSKAIFEEGAQLALSIGNQTAHAEFMNFLAFAFNGQSAFDEADNAARVALNEARELGDKKIETTALVNLLLALTMRREFEPALAVLQEIIEKGNPEATAAASRIATIVGAYVPRPEIVAAYAASIRTDSELSAAVKRSNPWAFLNNAFAAAARANSFEALDAALVEHRDWWVQSPDVIIFTEDEGALIARIGEAEGRAEAFDAAAKLLPRIAALIGALDPDTRDNGWLLKWVMGFAQACRDPGLLQDVAGLLTSDFGEGAEFGAEVLQSLAKVDEAPTPEQALGRLDPDVATLIRRLRDLPEPGANGSRDGGSPNQRRGRRSR